ncbi:hypothetical protein RRG08_051298 [Elysia crispata]|uniref:Integrase zinc-binding domain-containing protein n=1 Tax=Elysia crispata TaxID=231223 RepID=A0AAE0XSW5_9GAST|nr:hypothetical protein RRG08_051298 [Elysia crispata]
MPITTEKLRQIKKGTKEDKVLEDILRFLQNKSWPSSQRSSSMAQRDYYVIEHNMHEENGIIFFNNRMVIPESMREEMLTKLLASHLGKEKPKARASESIYRPKLNMDIEKSVKNCDTCAANRPQKAREPMKPHEPPSLPLVKVGVDIFDFGGRAYLLAVGYHSKFPEVSLLDDKTASSVIKVLKPTFGCNIKP